VTTKDELNDVLNAAPRPRSKPERVQQAEAMALTAGIAWARAAAAQNGKVDETLPLRVARALDARLRAEAAFINLDQIRKAMTSKETI
jgi:GAF domain-containing protein